MNQTPRGLRPHLILAGACNSGKSSLLNAIHGNEVAIVSAHSGTTTDPVFKNMELLPFGPVTFVDTPGLDDSSDLGNLRTLRSRSALGGGDLILWISRPSSLLSDHATMPVSSGAYHPAILQQLSQAGLPDKLRVVVVLTHADLPKEASAAAQLIGSGSEKPLASTASPEFDQAETGGFDPQRIAGIHSVSNQSGQGIEGLKDQLVALLQIQKADERKLLENLVKARQLVLMVVPIDLEAPAGRLILPQVQAIREALDADSASLVVKEREIDWALNLLKSPPDLAICDSQVVLKAAAAIPESIPLTTFSILFSRQKGDLEHFVKSAQTIDRLKDGDRVIIAETCSHKQLCDDIGRVKIPRWLRQYTGKDLDISVISGPLPIDLSQIKLIIHCGGCMITRRMMLSRMGAAVDSAVPITNYGIAISHVQGVLERVIKPFGLTLNGDS